MLKIFIGRLRRKFFSSKEDEVWKRWVDFKERKSKDLVEFLSSDVRDNFKRRAVFILLVPSADFNILYWKQKIGKFSENTDFLKVLTSDQLEYVADLIIEFSSVLMPMFTSCPGMTVRESVTEKYTNALNYYNSCILYLLAVLPEEKAKKIFSHYSLIDISTYCSMSDSSGYDPFGNLLLMEIDEKWKKMADDRMCEIINDEIAGKTTPRVKREEALPQYAGIIQTMLCGKISYSLEFLASQVQFIVDNGQYKAGLFSSYEIIKLFNLFLGDEYKELRHTIARYVLLEESESGSSCFTIYSKETQQAVDQILEEFKDDIKLVEKISDLEEESRRRNVELEVYRVKEQSAEVEKKAAEEYILDQMK
jgi:hypothetical protein